MCYWYIVCWQGDDCMCASKKVEGGGTTACLEHFLGNRDGGVGATGCLRYCYQRLGEPWEGSALGIFAWKKGRGSWCHGVPAILLPTFRGALGRGVCLEYLLGKRDGGVGASWCLRYCYQHFKKLWEGENARNAFKEVTVAAHVVRAMAKS